MKRVTITLIAVLTTFLCWSQNSTDGYCKISIGVHLSDKNIPQEAYRLLETKLKQIVSANGLADNDYIERFVITAKANVISKDITPSTPIRISQKVEITFMIGDVSENKLYQSLPITVTGIGENETKSYISAFNNIKPSSENFRVFIESAKDKMIQYYTSNGEDIINKAQDLARQHKYQQALYILNVIPNISTGIYRQAQDMMVQLLEQKTDYEAQEALNKARLTWAQSPNADGASGVAEQLSKVSALSSYQPQIDSLLNEITVKLTADEKREWEFQLQQYEDNKVREQRDFEFKVQQYKDKQTQEERRYADAQAQAQRQSAREQQQYNDDMAFRNAQLEASRQVALEYAKNQPKSVTYYNDIISRW